MDAVTAQLVISVIFLVIGVGLIYWISRRKFYRRNPMGAEAFSSHEASVFIRFIERVGKWIACALIAFGILSLWTYKQMKKEKEKQETQIKIGQSSSTNKIRPFKTILLWLKRDKTDPLVIRSLTGPYSSCL